MLGSIPSKAKRRFTLLLLEEKEYYFEDYAGALHLPPESAAPIPFTSRREWKGRLHVGSKSLFFDPDDNRHPIIRFAYDKLSLSSKTHKDKSTPPAGIEYISIVAREISEIQSNTPYTFVKLDAQRPQAEFAVTLQYAEFSSLLPLLLQLYDIAVKAPFRQKEELLQKLIAKRESELQFESSAISDIRERVVLPSGRAIVCSQVTPLVTTPGAFMLTDARLYFQPFNNVSSDPVTKYDIADIKRAYKRRYVMRDTGIEIFFPVKGAAAPSAKPAAAASRGRWGGGGGGAGVGVGSASAAAASHQQSSLFTFSSRAQRDFIFELLSKQAVFRPSRELSLDNMTSQWTRGQVSNYDYLMFLNQQAGRSFQDLTQYPVFPWVLSDYTSKQLDLKDPHIYRDLSKPVGALNPQRLETFRKRMREMPREMGAPFLYGTHYSSPGYVLYYLVRRAPQYQLKLQNGRFDQPDRLFTSVPSTWDSVLNGPADVKELIPEFYTLEGRVGDFLTNELGLDLGIRQNGKEVEDVELPPWAKSPRDFITKLRQALESEQVSKRLHLWIDLIFGFKQTGEEALKADNVFYYLTYEGAVDLEAVQDPVERRSLEAQINEFGQTPKKIFSAPHPERAAKGGKGDDDDDDEDEEEEEEDNDDEDDEDDTKAKARKASHRGSRSASTTDSTNPFASPSSASAASSNPFASPTVATAAAASVSNPFAADSPKAADVGHRRPPSWGGGAKEEKKDDTTASSGSRRGSAVDGDAQLSSTSGSSSSSSSGRSASPYAAPGSSPPPSVSTARDERSIPQPAAAASAPQLKPVVPSYMSDSPSASASQPEPATSSESASPSSATSVVTSSFSSASPNGFASSSSSSSDYNFASLPTTAQWGPPSSLTRTHLLSQHREAITSVYFSADSSSLLTLSADAYLRIYSLADNRMYRASKLGELTLSAMCALPSSRLLCVGSWDSRLYLYSIAGSSVVSSWEAHEDAVSGVCGQAELMVSCGWDACLKLWQLREADVHRSPLFERHEHETPIKCLALASSGSTAVTGSEDGQVLVWDLRSGKRLRIIDHSSEEITALACIDDQLLVCSGESDVKRYDRGGSAVCSFAAGEEIHAVAAQGGGSERVLVGGEEGVLRWLDMKGSSAREVGRVAAHQGAIRCLAVSPDGERVVIGTNRSKDNIGVWQMR